MKLFKIIQITFILLITLASCSKEPLSNGIEDYSIDETLAKQSDIQFAQEIFSLINEHRASNGLNILTMGTDFSCAYAIEHTNYMIELNEVNHHNFGIRSAALKSKGANQVGENVAYGYNTAGAVVNAWLNSPSHRNNIEGNYTHLGHGIKKSDKNNQYYFTQLFYQIQ